MPNLEQLDKQKERIINTIRFRGPSLPVSIAKVLGISPLFANVFLSELRAEGKLKVSDMRVGSSPLYFLLGQESQLEGFTKFLNDREKEAFEILKKELVLKDEELSPVMRVAMRAIKDFAVPVRQDQKTIWRYFTLTSGDFENILVEKFNKNMAKKEENVENSLQEVSEVGEIKGPMEKIESVESKAEEKLIKDFLSDVKRHLSKREIEIMDVFSEKKKEFEARVRVNGGFGKQEFYLIAKDKKSVTEKDFEGVWDKAHKKRLQGMFVSPGELNKKAKEHLREWGNLVKFERLN